MKPVIELSKVNEVKKLLRRTKLNTVCEESRCPNISECFWNRTATFMILGDRCTRGCTFCNVKRKYPQPVDPEEPYRLLDAVRKLDLKYVVITSVTRDDLPDGGASHFAECIRVLKENVPDVKVEVLVPDFRGRREALERVLREGPDVLNHNIETVKRLYPKVRIGSSYERSLNLLKVSKEVAPHIPTKSALIVGFGETMEEVLEAMADLRSVNCDFLTVGQYFAPSLKHYPVIKFYSREEFSLLEREAYSLGFKFVACGPEVRSSYRAFEGWLASQRS
ncbi:lipoic acid synthetase [Hydrogenivirga caldilitoris]|uniref:Lipoyl synthase n=1 Tax=Hydrogenivirga caldilitoris TaxID=246264 RepID=A0A497XPE9_9AQUI|nr:lipoyl synthase [Hydrogenivirga caldilitoris]RLJ70856.1 lipoic acid synthetase [Hydrogenivirga caldilitoris]